MAGTSPGDLRKRMKGVQIIMVTPFDQQGNVCIDSVRELTHCLIDRGIREARHAGVAGDQQQEHGHKYGFARRVTASLNRTGSGASRISASVAGLAASRRLRQAASASAPSTGS